jgi:type I restriction enzyme, S subunit
MIAGLKPYAQYEDSGLPWLGSVPAHWRTVRNGSLFGQRSQMGHADLPILEVSLKTGVQVRGFGKNARKQVMSDLGKYKRALKGDLAYNTMRMWQGALGVCPVDGLVSPAYVVARPYAGVKPRYFAALFRTGDYMAEIDSASRGIVKDRNRLYWDQFKQMRSPCPPPEEQAAIVRFLDWANGRLEQAIRAKRKVIALLMEQKQACVERAATLGLGVTVPLAYSGIPWLGHIPRHWVVRRLKHCISPLEQGWSPQCDAQPAGETEWGVLKVGCVNKDSLNTQQNKKLPSSLRPDLNLEIKDGDILMSRANTRHLLGLAALAEDPRPKLILCDKLFRFRTSHAYFNPKYLVLALRAKSCRAQIESSTSGASSSMQNIGQDVVKNLWLAIPPIEEQEKIVDRMAEDTQPLGIATSRLEREIELLDEYRVRLFTDVVTGKLDVREAVRQLPDDATSSVSDDLIDSLDEPELTDEEELPA